MYLPLEVDEIATDGLVDSGTFIYAISHYTIIRTSSEGCVMKNVPRTTIQNGVRQRTSRITDRHCIYPVQHWIIYLHAHFRDIIQNFFPNIRLKFGNESSSSIRYDQHHNLLSTRRNNDGHNGRNEQPKSLQIRADGNQTILTSPLNKRQQSQP